MLRILSDLAKTLPKAGQNRMCWRPQPLSPIPQQLFPPPYSAAVVEWNLQWFGKLDVITAVDRTRMSDQRNSPHRSPAVRNFFSPIGDQTGRAADQRNLQPRPSRNPGP